MLCPPKKKSRCESRKFAIHTFERLFCRYGIINWVPRSAWSEISNKCLKSVQREIDDLHTPGARFFFYSVVCTLIGVLWSPSPMSIHLSVDPRPCDSTITSSFHFEDAKSVHTLLMFAITKRSALTDSNASVGSAAASFKSSTVGSPPATKLHPTTVT